MLQGLADSLPPVDAAYTRDGLLSLRVRHTAHEWTWLGRSSIPRVRGEAILERFETGNDNVFVPGISAGYEVDRLLATLPATRAVFVWEQDAGQLALVLRVYDWSATITTRRLVLLTGNLESLTDSMVNSLRRHRGHMTPNRILGWPWLLPAEVAAICSAVQAACVICEQERAAVLAELRPRLVSAQAREGCIPTGGPSKVGLIRLAPHDELCRLTDVLNECLGQGAPGGVTVVPATPGDVHPSVMAARIVEAVPGGLDAVVTLGHTRHAVQALLPAQLPVVSWLSAAPNSPEQPAPKNLLFVTDSRHLAEASSRGWPTEQLRVLPHPCLAGNFDRDSIDSAARPVDLLVFANLPLTSPEAYGVKLPSHIHFWETAVALLRERIDTFTDDQIPALLKAAAQRSGVPIEDPQLLQQLGVCLGTHAARSLLWMHLLVGLSATDAKIALYGQGWGPAVSHLVRGPLPSISERVALLSQAKALLLADPRGEVGPDPLLAAAAGALVVARIHPHDREPGGLATLLEPGIEMTVFRRAEEVPTSLRHTVRADARRETITRKARERCATDHSPQARWAELWCTASAYFSTPVSQA